MRVADRREDDEDDVKTVASDQKIADFMEAFPLGSTQWVVAADRSGRYAGLVFRRGRAFIDFEWRGTDIFNRGDAAP